MKNKINIIISALLSAIIFMTPISIINLSASNNLETSLYTTESNNDTDKIETPFNVIGTASVKNILY